MSYKRVLLIVASMLCAALPSFAQQARLKVQVQPSEAYVFLDGRAIGEGARTLSLNPGKHTITVYNYGFVPKVEEIVVEPGYHERKMFALEPVSGNVTGPWGRIQIEGAPRAAVLLNGKTPEYFVGHGDEFDNNFIWKQQLIVPAGTHEITLMEQDKEIWSGTVTVPANEAVVVYVKKGGMMKHKTWPEGAAIASLPRFKAGLASARVAVAPVKGTMTVEPTQINCGDSVTARWESAESVHHYFGIGAGKDEVAGKGERSLQPTATTTYDFSASGPGGKAHSSTTVSVNPAVRASLSVTPQEIHYLKVGDKVLTQEPAQLAWTVSNARTVAVEPIGAAMPTGNETITPAPTQQGTGHVDETTEFRLLASNPCGGSDARTATLHIAGLIEPNFVSVFFPTAYPTVRQPETGLLRSQKAELLRVAAAFKLYLEHTPDARINLVGYADPRGSTRYNQHLSERRVAIIKSFLAANGIPEDKIHLEAFGETKPLSETMVRQLELQNPHRTVARTSSTRTTWLAYNRRVDLTVLPIALDADRHFPHTAADAMLLQSRTWQKSAVVAKAE